MSAPSTLSSRHATDFESSTDREPLLPRSLTPKPRFVRRPSTAPSLFLPSTFMGLPTSSDSNHDHFQNNEIHTTPTTLPRTSNTLRAKDRAALVRTTRKLEQVLGVAMKVVDDASAEASTPVSSTPSSPTSSSSHQPLHRRVTTKLSKSRIKAGEATGQGIFISTSTTSFSDAQLSPTTTPTQDSLQSPPTLRNKSSLICTGSYSNPSNDAPVLRLLPISPSAFNSLVTNISNDTPPRPASAAGRLRAGSVASNMSASTIDSTFSLASAPHHLKNSRPMSMPPSPRSPTFNQEPPRQRLLLQATKLHRHFGEPVPPQLVSATSASPSPASATKTLNHKRSHSFWPVKKKSGRPSTSSGVAESQDDEQVPTMTHRRGGSVDAGKGRGSGPLTSKSVDITTTRPRLDWTSSVLTLPPFSSIDSGTMGLLSSPTSPTTPKPTTIVTLGEIPEDKEKVMTPHEKSLNVRRAQKMAQRFGDAPPQALFQVTNIRIDTDQANIKSISDAASDATLPRTPLTPRSATADSFRLKRASMLTVNSDLKSTVSSENLAVDTTAGGKTSRRRSRGNSLSSVAGLAPRSRRSSIVSSGTTGSATGGRRRGGSVSSVTGPQASSAGSDRKRAIKPKASAHAVGSSEGAKGALEVPSVISLGPSTASDPIEPNSESNQPSRPPSTEPTSSSASIKKRPSHRRSDSIWSADDLPIEARPPNLRTHTSSSSASSFTTRRRRARKLSSFFGVDYPDLYQGMVQGSKSSVFISDESAPPLPSLTLLQELTRSGSKFAGSSKAGAAVAGSSKQGKDGAIAGSSKQSKDVSAKQRRKEREIEKMQEGSTLTIISTGKKSMEVCRWSQTDPEERRCVMDKLREMKA